MSAMPIGHETWFVDRTPMDWGFAFEAATLALLVLALVVTLAVRIAASRFPGVDVPFIGQMAPYMPFAVRIHLAVSLVGLLSLGFYLSPRMDLQADARRLRARGGHGGRRDHDGQRLARARGRAGCSWRGPDRDGRVRRVAVIQRADMLGLAVFVLLAGPGRWSADFELGRAARAVTRARGRRRLGAAHGGRNRADRGGVRREARQPRHGAPLPGGAPALQRGSGESAST